MLGLTGYLLVYRSYKMSMDTELRNAVSENNIVKASLEYELLDVLNSKTYNLSKDIGSISKRIDSGMLLSGSTMYVMAGDEYVYSGDEKENEIPASLIDTAKSGKKYIYQNSDGGHFLYISTPGYINKSSLFIITKKDISIVYKQLDENLNFLKIISMIVLSVSMLIIYLLTFFLTRPLEKLSKITTRISGGDYSVRANVNSDDEVGDLADSFNSMAGSVEEHVEELKDMVHRRDQFVADFTHEIKTPIAVIQNSAEMLRNPGLTAEKQQEYLDTITNSAKRLNTLITNILKLNKLERQTITPHISEFDLCEQLVQSALLFESVWEDKGIEFEADIADERRMITADSELLPLVWNNLLSNAFKFTDKGGTVILREYSENEKAVIEVEDSGCGMDEHTKKHIFDKFYQGDTSHSTEGNGLGLALALRVIQMSGGSIDVESRPGKGTRFIVKLNI